MLIYKSKLRFLGHRAPPFGRLRRGAIELSSPDSRHYGQTPFNSYGSSIPFAVEDINTYSTRIATNMLSPGVVWLRLFDGTNYHIEKMVIKQSPD